MNKPLILIVEDDAPIRNLISVTLEAHEYRHIAAPNAGTAILEASSHNPDMKRTIKEGDVGGFASKPPPGR